MGDPAPGIPAEAVEKRWRTALYLCLALPEAIPLLWVVVLFARKGGEPGGIGPLTLVFAALALVALAAAPLVRRIAAPKPGFRPPEGWSGSREDAVMSGVTGAFVAAYALAEIPLLLGFVATYLGAPLWVFAAFTAGTLLGYAMNFPRRQRWEAGVASGLEVPGLTLPSSEGPAAFRAPDE